MQKKNQTWIIYFALDVLRKLNLLLLIKIYITFLGQFQKRNDLCKDKVHASLDFIFSKTKGLRIIYS